MAVRSNMLIAVLLVSLMFLAVWALIGVYVYRDAKRRGMNAVAWTLIALLAPALIGFIIYLLVRGNYPDLECPRCGAPVREQFVVCPQCGAKLRPACPNCSGPVEPDWKVCPRCAAPLDGVEMHPAPPLRRRDKTLSKILIAIILVPVALIALAVLSFTVMETSTVGPSALQEVTFDEYLQAQESEEARAKMTGWINSLERSDQAYALRYDHSTDLDVGYDCFYLIYIPSAGGGFSSFGSRSGLFGTALELSVESSGSNGILYCMQTHADSPPPLRVTLDGKHIRRNVEVVDYNPTLFFIEPNYAQAEPGSVDLPERLSVVKLVGNRDQNGTNYQASENVGMVEVTDEALMLKILACIDSGERLPIEESPEFHFSDGFEIIVEYEIRENLIMHDKMARYPVFIEDGVCYLDDNRVRNTANGGPFRVMDADFYELLEELFE